MASFFSILEERIQTVDSLLCVGLDPHQEDLLEFTGDAARDFCFRLVEHTQQYAAAYKPNAAFFEVLGPEGIRALGELIDWIPDEIPVILDVKRGDISSTAQAYARSAFQTLGADAVTINPYLGKDAVAPFIANPAKGAFVLCKTSNPGAGDLQDLPVGLSGRPLYAQIAALVQEWNQADNLGLVIGATQLESLARVRKLDPGVWILAPGVGAQGGNLAAALEAGLREDGLGMLIPISRAISRAEDPGQQALEFKQMINAGRKSIRLKTAPPLSAGLTPEQKRIADGLLELGSIRFGEFTLKSGQVSPLYIDLRRLISQPDLTLQIGRAYIGMLNALEFDHLAALPYAGLPITSAISLLGGWSMIYSRKEEKTYGTRAQIEGVFAEGDTAVVIDDLITTGGSKIEGIAKLQENGLRVRDVVVLIDRSRNGSRELQEQGYQLHAYLTIADLLGYYRESGLVGQDQISQALKFLDLE